MKHVNNQQVCPTPSPIVNGFTESAQVHGAAAAPNNRQEQPKSGFTVNQTRPNQTAAILPITLPDSQVTAGDVELSAKQPNAERGAEDELSPEEAKLAAEALSATLMAKFVVPEKPPSMGWPTIPKTLSELADSSVLSFIVFSCVIANGIQMGVQVDYDVGDSMASLDHIFTFVFAFEMTVKVKAWKMEYFTGKGRKWNIFDFFLTWMSIIDIWILSMIGGGGGLKMLSVLRILRVFRIMRLLRMVKSLRDLTLVVNGFVDAMKTSFWVSLLLLLLLYIFAIFCSQSVGQPGIYPGYDEETIQDVEEWNSWQYFGTIPRSMFTLLNICVIGTDWFVVSRALMERQPGVLVLLLFFVITTGVGLMSVISGIVVDRVITEANALAKDNEKDAKKEMLHRLQRLYTFVFDLDLDGSGSIDEGELKQAWDREEMKDLLSIVNLPIGSEAEDLLDLIDANGDGELGMIEFVKSLVRLLTNDTFQHVLEVKMSMNRLLREVKLNREAINSKMNSLLSLLGGRSSPGEPDAEPNNLAHSVMEKSEISRQVQLMQQLQHQQSQQLREIQQHLLRRDREVQPPDQVQQQQQEARPEPVSHQNIQKSHDLRQQFQEFQQQQQLIFQTQQQHQIQLSQLSLKTGKLDKLSDDVQEVKQLLQALSSSKALSSSVATPSTMAPPPPYPGPSTSTAPDNPVPAEAGKFQPKGPIAMELN